MYAPSEKGKGKHKGGKGDFVSTRGLGEDEHLYVERRLKLYVGGLPNWIDDHSLQQHFGKYGPLVEATLCRKEGKFPFAFITYKQAADADAAFLDGHNFPGLEPPQHLTLRYQSEKDVKDKLKTEEELYPFLRSPDPAKIFVGYVQEWHTEDELGKFFSQWGMVLLVERAGHQLKGDGKGGKQKSRGFAFIHYASREAAIRIFLEKDNTVYLRGSNLLLKTAETSHKAPMDEAKRQEMVMRALGRHAIERGLAPPVAPMPVVAAPPPGVNYSAPPAYVDPHAGYYAQQPQYAAQPQYAQPQVVYYADPNAQYAAAPPPAPPQYAAPPPQYAHDPNAPPPQYHYAAPAAPPPGGQPPPVQYQYHAAPPPQHAGAPPQHAGAPPAQQHHQHAPPPAGAHQHAPPPQHAPQHHQHQQPQHYAQAPPPQQHAQQPPPVAQEPNYGAGFGESYQYHTQPPPAGQAPPPAAGSAPAGHAPPQGQHHQPPPGQGGQPQYVEYAPAPQQPQAPQQRYAPY
ncbi:unnamed protein product [Amoebophrya sp. A120]|nr:unnamed protein product [Amoebophrya sp. A120]|eukprot:GSA120T00010906001.1